MTPDGVSHLGSLKWPRFPYPGLRPFSITENEDESVIFFGRTENKDDVLDRLDTSQFVFIVGPSGCGKSSLVKVGIIPVLNAGLLPRAGSDWVTLQMRPGQAPLHNLAETFNENVLPGIDDWISASDREALLAQDRSGLWLLMDAIAPALTSNGVTRRVLLLIDQFEEIFSGAQEARAVDQFVGLITQFFRRPNPGLYLILTMRTDFIGPCANFPGLAEILNRTQYITPVLRGAALRDAIMRPAEAYGGEVEKALADQVMRDMGAGSAYDADHLPLMQHALLWLWWRAWQDSGSDEPPRPVSGGIAGPALSLTLENYQVHGGIFGILNHHADLIFADIERHCDRKAQIARTLFQRLSERDTSGRYKRAPARIKEIREICGASEDELRQVVAAFKDSHFIELRDGLGDEQLLDLSHESLIRQWRRLRHWADEEAEKYLAFNKLAEDALCWRVEGKVSGFLKAGGQLAVTQEWYRTAGPTAVWASRYPAPGGCAGTLASAFEVVQEYLKESEQQRKAEIAVRHRARFRSRALIASAVFTVIGCVILYSENTIESLKKHQQLLAEEKYAVQQAHLDGEVNSLKIWAGHEIESGRGESAIRLTESLLSHNEYNGEPYVITEAYRELVSARERWVRRNANLIDSDFSPDGAWVISKANDRELCLEQVPAAGRPAPSGDCITGIAPTLNGQTLSFIGGRWNPKRPDQIALFREGLKGVWLVPLTWSNGVPKGDPARAFPLSDNGNEANVGGAVFSADGAHVVTGGNLQPIQLWNAAAPGPPLATQSQSDKSPSSALLSLNADGHVLAEGLSDGGAQLWDIDADRKAIVPRKQIILLPAALTKSFSGTFEDSTTRAIAFSPKDPDLLLLAQGSHACVIDIGKLKSVSELKMCLHAESPVRNRSVILSLAFSPQGSRIASGDSDGYVHVWQYQPRPPDQKPGQEVDPDLVPLIGASDTSVPLYKLRFDKSDNELLTVGRDQTLRVFNVTPSLAPLLDRVAAAPGPNQARPAIASADQSGKMSVKTSSGDVTLGGVPDGFEAVGVERYQDGDGDWLAILPKIAAPDYNGKDRRACHPKHGTPEEKKSLRLCEIILYREDGNPSDELNEPVVYLAPLPWITPGKQPVYWREIHLDSSHIVAITQDGLKYTWPFIPDRSTLVKKLHDGRPLDDPDDAGYKYQRCLIGINTDDTGQDEDCRKNVGLEGAN